MTINNNINTRSRARSYFNRWCKGQNIEVLEYIGRHNRYYRNSAGMSRKVYLNILENNNTEQIRELYTWWGHINVYKCKEEYGAIAYYSWGFDGDHYRNNSYYIFILHKSISTYTPNLYKIKEKGVIGPIANGCSVYQNCWDGVDTSSIVIQ